MARLIQCPFMVTDLMDKKGECKISCECGRLTFHDVKSLRAYLDKYCGCAEGWRKCTLATNLLAYYDQKARL